MLNFFKVNLYFFILIYYLLQQKKKLLYHLLYVPRFFECVPLSGHTIKNFLDPSLHPDRDPVLIRARDCCCKTDLYFKV